MMTGRKIIRTVIWRKKILEIRERERGLLSEGQQKRTDMVIAREGEGYLVISERESESPTIYI